MRGACVVSSRSVGFRVSLVMEIQFVALVLFFQPHLFASDDALDALERGFESWLEELEFKSSYVYSEWIADTREEAEQKAALSQLTLRSHGEFIKFGKNTLYSCTVETDRYPVHQLEDFMAVIGDELEVHYVPVRSQQIQTGDLQQLFCGPRTPEHANLPYPLVASSPALDPLTYGGGKAIPNFISGCKRLEESGDYSFSWTIAPANEQKIELKAVLRGQSDTDSTFVRYSLQYSHPIPEEIIKRIEYTNPNVSPMTSRTLAEGFVEVEDGLFMPSTIHRFEGPLGDWLGEEFRGKWRVQLWQSVDLGEVSPTKEDFMFTLNPGTSVGGLQPQAKEGLLREIQMASSGAPASFDINSHSIDDLENRPEERLASDDGFSIRYLLIANLFLVVFVVLAMVARWRRSRAA